MHIHNTQFLVYTPVPMIYAPQAWDLNLMFVFISKKTLNTKKSLREMLDVQKEHKSVVFTAVECQQNVIFALVFYLYYLPTLSIQSKHFHCSCSEHEQ